MPKLAFATSWEVISVINRRPKVFCPRPGQLYYYVLPFTEKLFSSKPFEHTDPNDRNNFYLGNCFETENEVIAAIENLRVRALLRFYSSRAEWSRIASFVPIWEERIGTNQWSGFGLDFTENVYREGVYFPSRDAFEEALKQIGENRVKKYLGVPNE